MWPPPKNFCLYILLALAAPFPPTSLSCPLSSSQCSPYSALLYLPSSLLLFSSSWPFLWQVLKYFDAFFALLRLSFAAAVQAKRPNTPNHQPPTLAHSHTHTHLYRQSLTLSHCSHPTLTQLENKKKTLTCNNHNRKFAKSWPRLLRTSPLPSLSPLSCCCRVLCSGPLGPFSILHCRKRIRSRTGRRSR